MRIGASSRRPSGVFPFGIWGLGREGTGSSSSAGREDCRPSNLASPGMRTKSSESETGGGFCLVEGGAGVDLRVGGGGGGGGVATGVGLGLTARGVGLGVATGLGFGRGVAVGEGFDTGRMSSRACRKRRFFSASLICALSVGAKKKAGRRMRRMPVVRLRTPHATKRPMIFKTWGRALFPDKGRRQERCGKMPGILCAGLHRVPRIRNGQPHGAPRRR